MVSGKQGRQLSGLSSWPGLLKYSMLLPMAIVLGKLPNIAVTSQQHTPCIEWALGQWKSWQFLETD
jgi:hypothetical protein